MKKITAILISFVTCTSMYGQSVGIFGSTNLAVNNTGAKANVKAVFDISSPDKGLLIPRITTASRDTFTNIPTSLLIFNTTTNQYEYFLAGTWNGIAATGTNWLLTGNPNTVDGTHFIGTTDNIPFNIKVNNLKAGRIENDATTANTFFGFQSGNVNTGTFNTATGFQALYSNTTGNYNTAIGYNSLYGNTTGNFNTANGYRALSYNSAGSNATAIGYNAMYYANNTATPFTNYNVAVGYEALRGSLTATDNTGNYNTALGYQTLLNNTTGANNSASGFQALYSNTTGYSNIANGMSALYFNSTGYQNTASGYRALFNNTTGINNTANGFNALYNNNTGNNNTANGYGALFNNTTGINNTANGYQALYNNVAGNNGVAIGTYSQFFANNTATSWDNINTSVGYQSLRGSTTPSANTGTANTAIGRDALYSNTTGNSNTANGTSALYSNTTGNYNTANGYSALGSNTTAGLNIAIGYSALSTQSFSNGGVAWSSNNVAIGFQALYYNQPTSTANGYQNTALGNNALRYNTTGSYNIANGYYALYNNTTGNSNTALGVYSGDTYLDGSYNTFLGYGTDVGAATLTNCIAIGGNGNLVIAASNEARIGNASMSSIGGQVGWTTVSDARTKKDVQENVPGLAFINTLRPVTYNYDKDKEDALMDFCDSSDYPEKYAIEKILFSGFLAQEVEAAAKKLNYEFSGVDKMPFKGDYLYGLRYAEFTVPLVKAVQELDIEKEALKLQVQNLKAEIEKLQSTNYKQQTELSTLNSKYSLINTQFSELKTQNSELNLQYSTLQKEQSILQKDINKIMLYLELKSDNEK